MAYVAPSTVTAGTSPITAAAQNIIVNDILDHESRINSAGMVLVNATTFTASTAINLDNVFTSSYDSYRIMIAVTTTVSNSNHKYRFRVGGVNDSSGNYFWEEIYRTSAGVTGGSGGSGVTSFCANYLTSGTPIGVTTIDIFNPQLATPTGGLWSFHAHDSSTFVYRNGGFQFNGATQFDGFAIVASQNATGKIRVYGYKNS